MDMINEYDNVYSDISFTGCYKEFYIQFLNYLDSISLEKRKKIEDRILFGSDFSVNLLRVESYLNYYYIFDSSPLSDEFVHKIVSTNPMSFLGLKEKEEVKKKGMLSFFTKRLPNSNSSS